MKEFEPHLSEGWCGPACLNFVALQEGLHFNQDQLARILGTTIENGTDHYQMFCGAIKIGLQPTQVLGLKIETLAEVLPQYHVIVNWMDGDIDEADGHYSVLQEVKDGMVHLEDAVLPQEKFERKWYDLEDGKRVNRWAMIVKRSVAS